MTVWHQWLRQPQTVFLRKVLFQIHLWTGIGFGLYMVMICVSGSVLVYRNELYVAVFLIPASGADRLYAGEG